MDGMDRVAAGGIMGHASIPGAQANQGQTSTMSPFMINSRRLEHPILGPLLVPPTSPERYEIQDS